MANGYFNHATNVITSGVRALAAQVNNIATEIALGFDKFPTESELKTNTTIYAGDDTGVADAYVVALTYTPTLSDGLNFFWKAKNANTGASTINVNALGAKTILLASGAALQSGDILLNQQLWVAYESVSDSFRIMSQSSSAGGGGGNATTIALLDESSDTTNFIPYAPDAIGNQPLRSGTNLTFNAATGDLGVTTVNGRTVESDGGKLDGIETAATADQTDAEIRAAVEAAGDSNVFDDADHSKLDAIEPSATADQSNAEIRSAVEAATDSNVFTDADHTLLDTMIDLIHPIGDIKVTVGNVNPGVTLAGTTWTQISKGRALVGEGPNAESGLTTRVGGDTIGVEDSVVVSHTHPIDHDHPNPTTSSNGDHTHTGGISTASQKAPTGTNQTQVVVSASNATGTDGDHTHTVNIESLADTSGAASSGVSGTDKNMQPSLVVYIWERTA